MEEAAEMLTAVRSLPWALFLKKKKNHKYRKKKCNKIIGQLSSYTFVVLQNILVFLWWREFGGGIALQLINMALAWNIKFSLLCTPLVGLLLNGAGDLVTKDTEKAGVLNAIILLVLLVRPAFGNHRPLRAGGSLEQEDVPWWRRTRSWNKSSTFNTMTPKHFTWDCRIQVGLISGVLTKWWSYLRSNLISLPFIQLPRTNSLRRMRLPFFPEHWNIFNFITWGICRLLIGSLNL